MKTRVEVGFEILRFTALVGTALVFVTRIVGHLGPEPNLRDMYGGVLVLTLLVMGISFK